MKTQLTQIEAKSVWQDCNEKIHKEKWKNTTIYLFLLDLCILGFSFGSMFQSNIVLNIFSPFLLLLVFIHLYLIMHDAIHNLVSKNKSINKLIGHFCGWFTLLPFLPRQRNHLLHHIWVAHPSKDPENNKLIERYSVISNAEAKRIDFVWRNWIPLIALNHIRDTWLSSLKRGEKSVRRHKEELFAAAIYTLCYVFLIAVLLYLHALFVFIVWFLPAWIIFLMFIEMLNLPHHAEAPLLDVNSKSLPLWRQGEVSHSCSPLPIWSKYIILNFNMHILHHQFPMVPWYNLEKLQLLTGKCQDNKNEFAWSFLNRKRSLIKLMGHFFDKREKIYEK